MNLNTEKDWNEHVAKLNAAEAETYMRRGTQQGVYANTTPSERSNPFVEGFILGVLTFAGAAGMLIGLLAILG